MRNRLGSPVCSHSRSRGVGVGRGTGARMGLIERLRSTFDMAADLYQQARPEYPEQLYDVLIAAAELSEGDRLLEVGCATGKATIPLARRGFHVTGVELGDALAHAARRNLKEYPNVRIVCSPFETWLPPEPERFDMVFAATAWHWIDPAGSLSAGLGGPAPRRPPRLLERQPCLPRGRRPILPRDPGRLRRDRRGLTGGRALAPPGTAAGPEPGDPGERALRGHPRAAL